MKLKRDGKKQIGKRGKENKEKETVTEEVEGERERK